MAQLNAFNKDNAKDMAKDMARDIAGNTEHREGTFTKMIEKQTAKVPSVGFLGLAIGSMVAAIGLETFSRRRDIRPVRELPLFACSTARRGES